VVVLRTELETLRPNKSERDTMFLKDRQGRGYHEDLTWRKSKNNPLKKLKRFTPTL
jgi:hypothetical protein